MAGEEERAPDPRPTGGAGGPDPRPTGGAGGPDPRPTWDEIAERYGSVIYTMALRLTGDPHEAADLTQDVFVRVYRSLHRYQPGTFEGWLYRITRNLFLDRVRRQARLRMEELPEEDWRIPPATGPGPADVIERRTLEAGLEEGLRSLSPDFRLAIVLCDIEGFAYEEIAAVTGWPIGTVRSRIHRARKQLRDYLERHPWDEDGVTGGARRAEEGRGDE